MKLPNQPVVLCVLIVCLTLLIFTWLTRNSLCELRLKDGTREVSALIFERHLDKGTRPGVYPISANLRVEPSEECDASVPR